MPTIVATKGAPDANSYADVSFADAYIDELYLPGDYWSGMTADEKARLLITATRSLDRLRAKYAKADPAQKLKFPMAEVDGFDKAQEACVLQALFIYENSDVISEAMSDKIQGITSKVSGSVQMTKAGFNTFAKYHPDVLGILGKYLKLGVAALRG